MLSVAVESTVMAAGDGLAGLYYHNKDLTGQAFTRIDPSVNFDWQQGSPDSRIQSDTYSVRWTGFLEAPTTGTYTISTVADDGVRLWVNNQLLIDKWSQQHGVTNSATIALKAGQSYSLKMEYYESTGTATAKLQWSVNGSAAQAIPKQYLYTIEKPAAPTAPSALAAQATSPTQVSLTWADNSTNESGFAVERQTAGGVWAKIATLGVNTTQYIDATAAAGTQYGYRISAFNAGGSAGWSNTALATTPTPLDAVNTWHNAAFASQTGKFEVKFNAKPAAAGMDTVIGLSKGAAASYADLAAVVRFNNANQIDARNGGTYAATTAMSYTAGTTYQFRLVVDVAAKKYDVYVTAPQTNEVALAKGFAFRTEQASVTSLGNRAKFSTAGDATVSNFTVTPVVTAPAAPTGLTAQAVSTSQINLTWIDNASNETGYVVERLNGTTWTPLATLSANATSYNHTGLTASTQYTYRVSAVNTAGSSAWVQTAVATLAPTPAPSPNDALNTWYNNPIASQNGAFEIRFSATPRAAGADAVIGLSNSAAGQYADLATAVRFSTTNQIDARNGGTFGATTAVSYAAGATYQFRLVVDVVNKRYDVYVTPAGGAEVAVAKGFAFRAEQATVAVPRNLAQ